AHLVMGVSWRMLRHDQDAEDVFQATFLVLARKAVLLHRHPSVRGWLYQAAYRLAAQARRSRARWQARQHPKRPEAVPPADFAARELCSILDEELQRLPERQR